MKKTVYILALLLTLIPLTACDSGEHDRIPISPVRVEFASQAMWDQYGVVGSFIHRTFIMREKLPVGFPYTFTSSTGYAGLMLITNEHAMPYVYDLCCPVEINPSVRIEFDDNLLCLRCPRCGSTYDIATGSPMSGPAREGKYFLQPYNIAPFGTAGGYLIYR